MSAARANGCIHVGGTIAAPPQIATNPMEIDPEDDDDDTGGLGGGARPGSLDAGFALEPSALGRARRSLGDSMSAGLGVANVRVRYAADDLRSFAKQPAAQRSAAGLVQAGLARGVLVSEAKAKKQAEMREGDDAAFNLVNRGNGIRNLREGLQAHVPPPLSSKVSLREQMLAPAPGGTLQVGSMAAPLQPAIALKLPAANAGGGAQAAAVEAAAEAPAPEAPVLAVAAEAAAPEVPAPAAPAAAAEGAPGAAAAAAAAEAKRLAQRAQKMRARRAAFGQKVATENGVGGDPKWVKKFGTCESMRGRLPGVIAQLEREKAAKANAVSGKAKASKKRKRPGGGRGGRGSGGGRGRRGKKKST